jgi:hypothetical protein
MHQILLISEGNSKKCGKLEIEVRPQHGTIASMQRRSTAGARTRAGGRFERAPFPVASLISINETIVF